MSPLAAGTAEQRGVSSEETVSPLPHQTTVAPHSLSVLAQIWKVYPDLAERSLAMAERDHRHRIDIESRFLESQIRRSWWGLLSAWSVALAGLAVAGWVAIWGEHWAHAAAGAVIGSVDLVGLVTVFMRQSNALMNEG